MKRVTISEQELIDLPYKSEAERKFLINILLRSKGINTKKEFTYWKDFKSMHFIVTQEDEVDGDGNWNRQ